MTRFCSYLAFLVIALSGCSENGRTPAPRVTATIVNAAPSYDTVDFLREARDLVGDNIPYRGAAFGSFEADQYDFNVEVTPLSTAVPTNIGTFSATLTPNNQYHMVLAEDANGIRPIVVEQPAFDSAAANAELSLIHAAAPLGNVEAYFEAPGTVLTGATPLGVIDFLGNLPAVTRSVGSFRLFLTVPNDPTTVLFESQTFDVIAGQSNLFVLADGAGEGVAQTQVVRAANATALLFDIGVQSGVRVINAANDRTARDVYREGDFTAPLFPALAYGAPSTTELVPPGAQELNFTPVGNPGTSELDQNVNVTIGRIHTVIVTGDAGSLTGTFATENLRSIPDEARLQIINGAPLLGALDVFIRPPGTDITTVLPQAITTAPAITAFGSLAPDTDIEVTIRDSDTAAIVAGPTVFTLAGGRVYSLLLLDAVGGSTVDLSLLDDTN